MTNQTKITEQCGAVWIASKTEVDGPRAFWVMLVSGRSTAKPGIVGFYASSINAACDALNN